MKASGHIFIVEHLGSTYYYLPSQNTWVKDMKRISLGDIYFGNILVKAKLGSPVAPKEEDYSFTNSFGKKNISFELL